MVNGKIVKTSDSSLIEEVNENGFAAYENAE
jgi:Fe-S cluster assembly ATPase SufC